MEIQKVRCVTSRCTPSDLHLSNGIEGYFDLRQAIYCAQEQGKPMFLDYTGKACANCREMEQPSGDETFARRLCGSGSQW